MANAPATAEDRTALAAGFEPETILPSQLIDRSHLGAALQPEKRLMLAVLEDAVATFQRGTVSKTRQAARDFDEVGTWFASDDVTWLYSFLNICAVLDFDADYLRRGLARWRESTAARPTTGTVVPFRFAFRRISGSRTRAVVPRRLREKAEKSA
jgi:hypothetical protein